MLRNFIVQRKRRILENVLDKEPENVLEKEVSVDTPNVRPSRQVKMPKKYDDFVVGYMG